MKITQPARSHELISSPVDTAPDAYGKGKTLIDTLRRAHQINIADADKATRARYEAFTEQRPSLHPACALWFAKRCLAKGDKDLFRQVMTTFTLTRLQGIVESARIVTSCLKNLPHVHQIEFAAGCELTTECIVELGDALKERREVPFELNLHGCTVSCDTLMTLAWALPGLRGLSRLSISYPQVTDDADWITDFGPGIAGSTQLLAFKLDMLDLREAQIKAFGNGLAANRSLIELHLSSKKSSELMRLLACMCQRHRPDPASPGTAAPPLESLRVVGCTPNPRGSIGVLIELMKLYPSLKYIQIAPALLAKDFDEVGQLMTLCSSKSSEIDIDVEPTVGRRFLTPNTGFTDASGRACKPDLPFIQRKEASRRLLQLTAKEFQTATSQCLAIALASERSPPLPNDAINEIVLWLMTDRSAATGDFSALCNLSRVNKATAALDSVAERLRRTHVQRLKGLLTFSAFAFGTSELADMLCLKLAGIPLHPEHEEELKSMLQTMRPDNDRLSKAIRKAEDDRWDTQWTQACDLATYHFRTEFLAAQKRMRKVLSANPNSLFTTIRQTSLSRAAFFVRAEEKVTQVVKGLISPRRQQDSPDEKRKKS
jgi:hypothetical protein